MYQMERPLMDFDTAKIQYELLGDSFPKISAGLNIAVDSLQRVSDAEGWQRIKSTTSAYNNYLAGILNSHRAKISLAMLYRELEMFPQVAQLETVLLHKLMQAAGNVDPYDPKAPQQLRHLTGSMNSITERQVVIKKQLAEIFSDPAAPQGVQTKILMDLQETTHD